MTRGVASLRAAAAGLTFLVIGTVAACGSSAAPPASGTGAAAGGSASRAASMATSIASGLDSWAVVPMTADPAFWQVFVRAGNSGTWKLVTPPGVPTNGGIVASADGASALTVTVRPSEYLKYSPLAATANGGASWSTAGPIDAAVAASPDSFAADGSHLAALLSDGTIETSSDAGTTWSTLAKPAAIASSPAAKGCGGTVRVTSVSFGISSTEVLAGGTCGASGTAVVFAHSASGGWQRLGLPVSGQLMRLTSEMALVQGKSGLSALWRGFGWYAYAPLTGKTPQAAATNWDESAPLPVSGPVTASGTLPGGGVWVLLPGGRGATVNVPGRASQEQWTLLPPVPAHTSVLASGPDDSVDALAVSGAKLTVWRLAKASTGWSEVETITVPIQYGSSS